MILFCYTLMGWGSLLGFSPTTIIHSNILLLARLMPEYAQIWFFHCRARLDKSVCIYTKKYTIFFLYKQQFLPFVVSTIIIKTQCTIIWHNICKINTLLNNKNGPVLNNKKNCDTKHFTFLFCRLFRECTLSNP